ncbi:MAG: DUF4342 domain-containing protein [Romboutsia sp.]|uniref:DUF4342 domain-containing protein n=1 Tax=Romboutsia sp. TaxID=1965302 RepID=UPI003F3A8484
MNIFRYSWVYLDNFSRTDIIESILYLEEQKKLRADITMVNSTVWDKCKEVVEKLNNIKIEISKDGKTALRVPSTVAIIAGIIGMPVVIVGLVLTVFTGHKIRFENENGSFSEINDKMDIVTEKAHDFTTKL